MIKFKYVYKYKKRYEDIKRLKKFKKISTIVSYKFEFVVIK